MTFFNVDDVEKLPKTFGELKRSSWKSRGVKKEIRENLIEKIKKGEKLFDGILGYEHTVEEQIVNALLCEHNFILLGLRGQGKTKIIRQIFRLLDPYLPVIEGSSLNEDPFSPISSFGREMIEQQGDQSSIKWLSREERFKEKLATPDVSIADLIGDLDPIKAVREKMDISNEKVIHWGIVPRSNRGIFAINELPDLQPRIQVGLLNIMEEKDIQVRGFPLRIPMDILLIFSANPEDYTNRGKIITPLKDRIDSQIITHYPRSVEVSKKITEQEAKIFSEIKISSLVREAVERIVFFARKSDLIDGMSGVSQRLSISALEIVLANAQRRMLWHTGSKKMRWMDIYAALPAITGKVELMDQRNQEDLICFGFKLIGMAAGAVFDMVFPPVKLENSKKIELDVENFDEEQYFSEIDKMYLPIIDFFKKCHQLKLSDEMDDATYEKNLSSVTGLKDLAKKYTKVEEDVSLMMEILLDGLCQHAFVSREIEGNQVVFYDVYSSMFEKFR